MDKNTRKRNLSRREFLKITGAAMTVAGVSPLLQACGQPTAAPTTAIQPTSVPSGFKFPAAKGAYSGQTLNVSMVAEPKPIALKAIVSEFEAMTGAKVNFEDMPYPTLQEKQFTAVSQNSGAYDVVHVDCVWMGQYAGQGWLASIEDFIHQTDPKVLAIDDFEPNLFKELCDWKGLRYGLPFDTSIMMYFYRPDLLQKYNLAVPETWDDVYNAAKTITDNEKGNDVFGLTVMAKRGVQLICTYFAFLGAYGGYPYDEKYIAKMDSPEAIQALNMLIKLIGVCNPGTLAQDYDEADATFANGKAAMIPQWNDSFPRYDDPNYSKIIGKWSAAQVPGVKKPDGSIKRASVFGGWNTGILTDSKEKELAWEFLVWATTKDMDTRLASVQAPARISVLKDPAITTKFPVYGTMVETLKIGWGRPRLTVWPQMSDNIEAALSQAVSGEKPAEKALTDVNVTLNQILKDAGLQT